MSLEAFTAGYIESEPDVNQEQIGASFVMGDRNGSGDLDIDEFMRLFELGKGPPPECEIDEHLDWYWRNF